MQSKVLRLMALALSQAAMQTRAHEIDLRGEARTYADVMAIPEKVRLNVIMNKLGCDEAQATRFIDKLSKAHSKADNQCRQRTHFSRKEARSVHLARMFLKGTPYRMVENISHTAPNWSRVMELVSLASDVKLVKAPKENKTPNESNIAWNDFNNWARGN